MLQTQRTQTSEINATQSLNLIKNLLRSGLSCVAFMRGMFPAECFKKQKISGITVHTLQPTEPEPRKLMDWIDQGCLPSLEKRYLEELIFAIYAKLEVAGQDQFYLIETYNFQIRYHENDVVMTRKAQGVEVSRSIPTKQEISQATVSMIRSLISMGGTMPPLPEDRAFSIKLLYRDDVTPEDYQPMHFRPVTSEHQLRFFSKPEAVAIGNIATPYHELNLHVLVPDDYERELAAKFSTGGENSYIESYPAYTATINDSISATLSEHIVPCSLRNVEDDDTSEAIDAGSSHQFSKTNPIHKSERDKCPQRGCDDLPHSNTKSKKLNFKFCQNSNQSEPQKTASCSNVKEVVTVENEATGLKTCSIQKRLKLSFAEINELLAAIRSGICRTVPNDIYEISTLAAERLDQLIEMYSCQDFDEMQSLYLRLEAMLFLNGSAPTRAVTMHFRGTKLSRKLIRDHLNKLVESGLAIRDNKSQVKVNQDPLPQSQMQKAPVDDDAETIDTEEHRAVTSISKQTKEMDKQSALDHLTTRLQKHIENGVVALTQSDMGTSQISRTCPRTASKRKISTSEDIYQTSNKRVR